MFITTKVFFPPPGLFLTYYFFCLLVCLCVFGFVSEQNHQQQSFLSLLDFSGIFFLDNLIILPGLIRSTCMIWISLGLHIQVRCKYCQVIHLVNIIKIHFFLPSCMPVALTQETVIFQHGYCTICSLALTIFLPNTTTAETNYLA